MKVGICKLELFLPENHSLKEKRSLLRAVTGKTSQKFKVPVMEVGYQDLWQRAEIGFSIVGNEKRVIESLMLQMVDYIENLDLGQITQKTMDIQEY